MNKPINHNRLDQITNWSPVLGCEPTVAEEFEALRKFAKRSRGQQRRIEHLERHLDAGELICDCYEEFRTDLL